MQRILRHELNKKTKRTSRPVESGSNGMEKHTTCKMSETSWKSSWKFKTGCSREECFHKMLKRFKPRWFCPPLRHTYIHNWLLQPFSQAYGLASHTTHVVCVNFICEWRDLQFNVDSERQILRNFFMAGLFTFRVFARNLKSPKKYFSYFIFDDWTGIRTQVFAFNKPTHYILDHGGFKEGCANYVANDFFAFII